MLGSPGKSQFLNLMCTCAHDFHQTKFSASTVATPIVVSGPWRNDTVRVDYDVRRDIFLGMRKRQGQPTLEMAV